MSIVIIAPAKKNLMEWKQAIENYFIGQPIPEVYIWPQVGNPTEVEMAVCWKHPIGSLNAYPNLKVICSMGAGVDHIFADTSIPNSVLITRIVSQQLAVSMTRYLLAVILRITRRMEMFEEFQKDRTWGYTDEPELNPIVGIMGMGVLGSHIASALHNLEIPVIGYARTHISEKFRVYTGTTGLSEFLGQADILIILLPLTHETRGFINYELLTQCRPNVHIINVARGEIINEPDLLKALDQGLIHSATLDVFSQEPLPKNHPFWSHEKITITPHISSITNPLAAVPQVCENYNRLKKGLPLLHTVDKKKEY
jgi:glyoxylate/hydroxypyruvate reductase A